MSVTALSHDSQAIALACSSLGLAGSSTKPLTPKEWNALATAVHRSELKRPGRLLGLDAGEIEGELGIGGPAAARVAALLARGGQFALELERLSGRGIWLLTRADDDYPARLKERLGATAPPILFGAGRPELLRERAIAVVGSRDADPESLDLAQRIGRSAARSGVAVVSGAARGVDAAAMVAVADAEGVAVGVIADALEKMTRRADLRDFLVSGNMLLLSPYHPAARFNVGNAMARNRLIYCLAEAALVVASGETGGTYAGALEDINASWVPLFVLADRPSAGMCDLMDKGALPIAGRDLDSSELLDELAARALGASTDVELNGSLPAADSDGDVFVLVWPQMRAILSEGRTEREVADVLKLELGQARAWLKRAQAEGLAEKAGRPLRWQATAGSSPTLFPI